MIMANRCQLCGGFTATLRRNLCRVCFDGNIRPSELFDEMATMTAAPQRTSKAALAAAAGNAKARGHVGSGNGSAHARARAQGSR
jgi:hypothetical protein